MLARNSSVIQPARTGVTGSARAAGPAAGPVVGGAVSWVGWSDSGSATSLMAGHPSAEALAFTPVGGHRAGRGPVLDQVVVVEPLGQLARLRVLPPDPVPHPQPPGDGAQHRGLDLPGPLGAGQLEPGRPVRRGRAVP